MSEKAIGRKIVAALYKKKRVNTRMSVAIMAPKTRNFKQFEGGKYGSAKN
jgi:hypothetical protein